jgi:hypothetical protein
MAPFAQDFAPLAPLRFNNVAPTLLLIPIAVLFPCH